METPNFLVFATDSNQLYLFKSDLSLAQTMGLPAPIKRLFLVNQGQLIIAFTDIGQLATLRLNQRSGVVNSEFVTTKCAHAFGPQITQVIDLSDRISAFRSGANKSDDTNRKLICV